jgi:nucleoside 2-deoxyribosyltransferase
LAKYGINVIVAEWFLEPGTQIEKSVLQQIDNSDCVIALMTPSGARSNWIPLEIGYALKAGKVIIPLVEKGVEAEQLKALRHLTIIEYDPLKPHEAISKASTYVTSMKLKKQEQEELLLIVGGILAFLLLLYMAKE